jgi:hypothetical protein
MVAAARTTWKLQYASGLFAGRGWRRAMAALSPRAAPQLALLGNCGSVATKEQARQTGEFMRAAADIWDAVFWVLGPGELQGRGGTATQRIDALRELANSKGRGKVILMDQTEIPIPGQNAVLLGAAGWDMGAPAAGWGSSAADTQQWGVEDMVWLYERTSWWGLHDSAQRKIVLTHHLCSRLLIPFEKQEHHIQFKNPTAEIILHFQPYAPFAWLCGAGDATITGFIGSGGRLANLTGAAAAAGPKRQVYGGVNSLFSSGECHAAPNPHYRANQVLEINPPMV